jgi:3-phenylpropionate/trans-cinnamate dioxygenase ferredoxin reductase subunit
VELRLGERVDDVSALGADVVLAGLGARPATAWLSDSGLELQERDGAVVVDEYLRAARPGVVAAGDCAAWWSKRYDRRLRVEHWDTALHAPAVAVASLLGDDGEPYDPVPYFWSHQFGHNLQFVGHRADADDQVVRGDTSDASWGVGWFNDNDELTAFLTVDHPRDLTQARRTMVARCRFDRDRFADPATPVKAAAIS